MLLRTAAGLTAVLEGLSYLNAHTSLTAPEWIAAGLTAGSGFLLLAGFLTPIVGAVIAFGALGIALALVPLPPTHFLDNTFAATLVFVLAIASALVGPGAFSIDCYLFGRREIVIPPDSRS